MLSKSKISYLQSLKLRKFRQKYNIFIAEGEKIAEEILFQDKIIVKELFATQDWLDQNHNLPKLAREKMFVVSERELKKISNLVTPNKVFVVAKRPMLEISPDKLNNGLSLYLDGIRDPGNMGTMLRIADWFGLEYVFTSPDAADVFHPKVVQASMGAFLRIPAARLEFAELKALAPDLTSYGMVLEGKNLFQQQLQPNGIIVIGNESQGIRPSVQDLIDIPVKIPPGHGGKAESLNAAVATGIVCAMFRNQ